jgi:L-lactate dehydrogenase
MPDVAGISSVTLALPHLVGRQGILGTLPLPLAQDEEAALRNSAQIIKQASEQLVIPR